LSSSPASLRLVPGLAGTAMIPIAAALARRAGGTRAGLYGAATVAVLPELVHLSRDARMYALAGTLVTACSLALWRAVERPSVGRLSVLAACVALAVHTQYFAALAVAVQLAAAARVLRAGRAAMRRAAAAAAAGGLTLVPWLIAASAQFQHNQTPFWMSRVTAASLGDAAADLFQGDAAAGTQLATRTLQDLCIGIAALAGLVVLVVALRTPWPRFRPTAYLAIAGLGAMAALVALSLFRPLFDPRYLSVLWGPSLPLLGIGLAR